jgi:hypothetical protein
MKFNMPQRLLLFPSNKQNKIEMQKHKNSDNLNDKCRFLPLSPKTQIGKGKYECGYYN